MQTRWDDLLEEQFLAEPSISPVCKVPPEILGEIFAQCVQSTSEPTAFSSTDAMLLLTTVSRRWRQVALDTPRLWRNITIRDPPGTVVFKPSFISTIVRNSRPHTLYISIDLIRDGECYKDKYTEIIELVRAQYHRIERWTLKCSESIAKALFRPGERYYMANLCDLSVDFFPRGLFRGPEWGSDPPIIEAPRLNSLRFGKARNLSYGL